MLKKLLILSAIACTLTAVPLLPKKLTCSERTDGIDTSAIYSALKQGVTRYQLDPVEVADVPPQQITFHWQLTNHKGTLSLTKGNVVGISTLAEAGSISIECSDNSAYVKLPISFRVLTTTWDYSLKSGLHNPSGILRTTHNGLEVSLVVNVDLATGELSLRELDYVQPGNTNVWSTNLGNIEQVVNDAIENLFIDNVNEVILQGLEENIAAIIGVQPPVSTTTTTSQPTTTTEPTTDTTTTEPTTDTTTTGQTDTTTTEPTTDTTTTEPTTDTTTTEPTTDTTTTEPTTDTTTTEPTTDTTTTEPTTDTTTTGQTDTTTTGQTDTTTTGQTDTTTTGQTDTTTTGQTDTTVTEWSTNTVTSGQTDTTITGWSTDTITSE